MDPRIPSAMNSDTGGEVQEGRGGGAGKWVIRCNVANLLLAVIIIEGVWLGFWLFLMLISPPGLAHLEPEKASQFQEQMMERMPVKIFKPDLSDMIAPGTIATGCVILFTSIFFLTLFGLVLSIIGYQKQSLKLIKVFFVWLFVWNLIILALFIYASAEAPNVPKRQYIKKPQLKVKIKNGFMDYGDYDADDAMDMPTLLKPPSLIIIIKKMVRNLNWFFIPLIIIKGVTWIFQMIATFLAIRYFEQQSKHSYDIARQHQKHQHLSEGKQGINMYPNSDPETAKFIET